MPKLSLRALLIIPFVVLILILTTIIAWLSYDASQRTAYKLVDSLTVGVAERVRVAVERQLAPSHLVLEAALPSLRENFASRVDADLSLTAIEAKLRVATKLNPSLNNYIYYGNTAKQFVGVSRKDSNEIELRIKPDSDKPRQFFKERLEGAATPIKSLVKTETTIYDPVSRPWFKAASAAKAPAWTSVYPAFSSRDLIVTLAHPIYRRDGTIDGVLSTDVSLTRLNDFLASVPISANGVAILFEANGDIIATSAGAPLFHEVNGVKTRLNAAQSDNRLIREAYAQFAPQLNGAPSQAPVVLDFSLDKSKLGTVHAALSVIPDAAGLKWYSLVAMPHDDFMAGARGFAWQSMIIGLFVAGVALLFGYGIVNRLARDLMVLNEATKAVATGSPPAPLPIERDDEIGDLARQFERMHVDLQEDKLTGAINRETFSRIVGGRFGAQTRLVSAQVVPFALFFIDLNGFKAINDAHGHLVGDEVLITVANRTRAAVRASDIVARFGGDEFVVFVDNVTDANSAQPFAEKILGNIAQVLVVKDGLALTIDAALGMALYPEDGEDLETLLRIADSRMYQHKASIKL